MGPETRESVPLVATAFLSLPRRQDAKHPYTLERTVLVPADYYAFCSNGSLPSPCATIVQSRARARGKWRAGVQTEARATTMAQLVDLLSAGVGLPAGVVRAAARRSVDPLHCPSVEIVMIWLAKPFLVAAAIAAHPERQTLFAWVDAGFNVYQMRPFGPPPPPWPAEAHTAPRARYFLPPTSYLLLGQQRGPQWRTQCPESPCVQHPVHSWSRVPCVQVAQIRAAAWAARGRS